MISPEMMLREQYAEAVRLHLWYTGSKFSVHRGKTSREQAERYLRVAHTVLSQVKKSREQ